MKERVQLQIIAMLCLTAILLTLIICGTCMEIDSQRTRQILQSLDAIKPTFPDRARA